MGSAANTRKPAIVIHNADENAHPAAFDAYNLQSLQTSPDFLNTYSVTWDDFPNTSSTTGQIGMLGWGSAVNDTGQVIAATTGGTGGANGRPNVLQMLTGAGTAGGGVISLGKQQMYGHKDFIWEASVFLTDVNNGTDDITFHVGLHDDTTAASPTTPAHGFYFLYSPADTSVHCVTTSDSTPDNQDSGFVPTADTWMRLRIESDGGGNAYFYINDMETPVTSHTTAASIPDTTATDLYGRCFHVRKSAGTNSRSLMIDYEYFRVARA